jgi:hypothetical protein
MTVYYKSWDRLGLREGDSRSETDYEAMPTFPTTAANPPPQQWQVWKWIGAATTRNNGIGFEVVSDDCELLLLLLEEGG